MDKMIRWDKKLESMFPEKREYAINHLALDIISSERWGRLEELLLNIFFLEAKTEVREIYELVEDFAEAAKSIPSNLKHGKFYSLIEEAIRRDIHFIERHPTSLFQCLWNTCWWYDCPEADKHYNERYQKYDKSNLHVLLEKWRVSKQKKKGFCWLRALRPPESPVGNGLQATIKHPIPTDRLVFCDIINGIIIGVDAWGDVYKYDISSGKQLDHFTLCDRIFFASSPDNNKTLVITTNKGVEAFDTANFKKISQLSFRRNDAYRAYLSPDKKRYVIQGWYNATDNKQQLEIIDIINNEVIFCHYGANKLLGHTPVGAHYIVSIDNALKLIDKESCKVLAEYPLVNENIIALDCARSGKWCAVATNSSVCQYVKVLALPSLECLARLEFKKFLQTRFFGSYTFRDNAINSVNVCFDNEHICISHGNKIVICSWNRKKLNHLSTYQIEDKKVYSAKYTANGDNVITVGEKIVKVWDSKYLLQPETRIKGHSERISDFKFSSDGKYIVSASIDGTMYQWNTEAAEVASYIAENSPIQQIIVFPSGDRIACVCDGKKGFRVWNLRTKKLVKSFRRKDWKIDHLTLNEYGNMLAFITRDEKIIVLDIKSGRVLYKLHNKLKDPSAIALSSSSRLFVGYEKGTICVWQLNRECRKRVFSLPCDDAISEFVFMPNFKNIVVSAGKNYYSCHAEKLSNLRRVSWRKIHGCDNFVKNSKHSELKIYPPRGNKQVFFPVSYFARIKPSPDNITWSIADLHSESIQIIRLEKT